jgi:hypothetical protein
VLLYHPDLLRQLSGAAALLILLVAPRLLTAIPILAAVAVVLMALLVAQAAVVAVALVVIVLVVAVREQVAKAMLAELVFKDLVVNNFLLMQAVAVEPVQQGLTDLLAQYLGEVVLVEVGPQIQLLELLGRKAVLEMVILVYQLVLAVQTLATAVAGVVVHLVHQRVKLAALEL